MYYCTCQIQLQFLQSDLENFFSFWFKFRSRTSKRYEWEYDQYRILYIFLLHFYLFFVHKLCYSNIFSYFSSFKFLLQEIHPISKRVTKLFQKAPNEENPIAKAIKSTQMAIKLCQKEGKSS